MVFKKLLNKHLQEEALVFIASSKSHKEIEEVEKKKCQLLLRTILDVHVKLIVQVPDVVARKDCPGVMLVFLVKRQSAETLKLLVNFQMMRKSSFNMD